MQLFPEKSTIRGICRCHHRSRDPRSGHGPECVTNGVVIWDVSEKVSEQVVTTVFDTMAAFTFLYVAVIDIIKQECARPEQKRLKFNLLAGGLGCMARSAVCVWPHTVDRSPLCRAHRASLAPAAWRRGRSK